MENQVKKNLDKHHLDQEKDDREKKHMNRIRRIRTILRALFLITIGTLIYSAGISLLIDPNDLAPGGVSGISIMLSRFTPIPTGTWILIINIPLLVFGWWKLGRKFIIKTCYATVMTSLFTNLLSTIPPVTNDLICAVVLGGIAVGTGIGLVFRAGGTTGGMDIIVKLLRLKYPYLKSGSIFLVLDMLVVIASGFVFQNLTLAVYAGIVIALDAKVMDVILYGQDEARLIYIISDKHVQIASRLMEELNIGVTYLEGEGAYTEKNKMIILCATRKQRSPEVINIVKEEDARAFLIVSSANEIFGEGYKSYWSEQL
jgi:uncharacterized membrane-anchored protein YitT (DUF2179 family)